MIVVLKNKDNIEGKLESLMKEMIEADKDHLKIVVSKNLYENVKKELDLMEFGRVSYYMQEEMYITDYGIKIELLKADKYV